MSLPGYILPMLPLSLSVQEVWPSPPPEIAPHQWVHASLCCPPPNNRAQIPLGHVQTPIFQQHSAFPGDRSVHPRLMSHNSHRKSASVQCLLPRYPYEILDLRRNPLLPADPMVSPYLLEDVALQRSTPTIVVSPNRGLGVALDHQRLKSPVFERSRFWRRVPGRYVFSMELNGPRV